MKEILKSVGIDIGTTTTQLIFSSIEIENRGGGFSVPRFTITGRRVEYRSAIYFTPLINNELIDGDALRDIVVSEYKKAGAAASDISAGAVIITGETARKENAKRLLHSLSDYLGGFVVATAGSDLESAIAGRGAGACDLSRERGGIIANFDIGGGTTNVAVFDNGELADTTCLDIGGRLVRIEPESMRVLYVAPKLAELIQSMGLDIREGRRAEQSELRKLTRRMAALLDELCGYSPRSPELSFFTTAREFGRDWKIGRLTFSGGVADCIYNPERPGGLFRFGDIGVLLAEAVREKECFTRAEVFKPRETISATVIGAGSHTVKVTGSTINYTADIFPLKNVPVLKIREPEAGREREFTESLARRAELFRGEEGLQNAAVAMRGMRSPSFGELQRLAELLAEGLETAMRECGRLIIVLEEDMGKALGLALRRFAGPDTEIVCIDGIHVEDGDYIDIGKPMGEGRVMPVVVKTLVFGG